MENQEIYTNLISLLDKLKRNLDVAPLDVLKTKYKKPFEELCQEICAVASTYVKHVSLENIRIRKEYFSEAAPIIQAAIQQSGLLQQISTAAFRRQSVSEIEALAHELQRQIQNALEQFYAAHICLCLSAACFEDPPQIPELYNAVTDSIWSDGVWKPLDKVENAILLSVK